MNKKGGWLNTTNWLETTKKQQKFVNLLQNRQIIETGQNNCIPASKFCLLQRTIWKKNTSKVKLADRHSFISFLFKNRNICATLNASNSNLTEERDFCRYSAQNAKNTRESVN